MLNKLKMLILQDVIPHLYTYFSANKKIGKNIQDMESKLNETTFGDDYEDKELENLSLELKRYQEKERNQRDRIDDKAKASLFIIALTITLIIGSLNFINGIGKQNITLFLFGILILGVIYLISAGIASIKAFNVREFHDIYFFQGIENDNNKYKLIDKKKEVNLLHSYIELNQERTRISTNYVYSTFIDIRNGLILVALFFITAIFNGIFTLDNLTAILTFLFPAIVFIIGTGKLCFYLFSLL